MKNKIKKIEELIKLTEKKLSLLEELKKSLLYENADYSIKKLSSIYILYDIADNKPKLVKSGTLNSINLYLKRRNIPEDKIFIGFDNN